MTAAWRDWGNPHTSCSGDSWVLTETKHFLNTILHTSKNMISQVVTLCTSVETHWCLGRSYCLHILGWGVSQTRSRQQSLYSSEMSVTFYWTTWCYNSRELYSSQSWLWQPRIQHYRLHLVWYTSDTDKYVRTHLDLKQGKWLPPYNKHISPYKVRKAKQTPTYK